MGLEPLVARRLAAALGSAQVAGKLPSVAAAVVRDGEVVWTSGDPDLQYRIGSITKTITAVLVLQLRDEGALALSDPIGEYLPGVGFGDRTIQALLSHTGGLPSEPAGPWWERSPGVSFQQLASAIDELAAPFPQARPSTTPTSATHCSASSWPGFAEEPGPTARE